jgi:hypothetical protein
VFAATTMPFRASDLLMTILFDDEVSACVHFARRHDVPVDRRFRLQRPPTVPAAAANEERLRAVAASVPCEPFVPPACGTIFVSPGAAVPLALWLACGDDGWDRVYHGTSCDDAFAIAVRGFDPSRSRRGKSYGPGIYVTPSWNMAPHWASDEIETLRLHDGRELGVVLQCRVRPDSFRAHALTWDPPPVKLDVEHARCEYVVSKPEHICVEAILFVRLPGSP